jgi:signal transduction histidine kinase
MASGIAIWSAVQGTGPFATETLVEKMITLQVFNVCVALTSFVLATFVATRQRQEEVIRRYAAANAAGEAKTAFLNLAAHELRTPLTVLTGHLSTLSDGSHGRTPDSWKMPFRTIVAKAGELNRIVETLLQASHVEVEAAPVGGEVIDLRQVIDDAVSRALPRADLLRADISTTHGREAVLVEADKAQLGRVLDNLINNGLSYSAPPARVFIELATESHRAVVRVEDSGEGIPEGQREQVFERFYRGAGPLVAKVPGVGLGLHISRQLAEHNGGSLVIESSTLGVGTVFALALPLAGPT